MDIRYLAGFFDGEGSISLRHNGTPIVSLKQTDRPILDRVAQKWGGRVYGVKVVGNRKPVWQWNLQSAASIETFLTAVAPYLTLKRPQANILLQALHQSRDQRGKHIRALRELNRRGRPLSPRHKTRVVGRRVLERSR